MDEVQLAQQHENWLQEGRNDFLQQELPKILLVRQDRSRAFFCIRRKLLMLLTLERDLSESLRQAAHGLPPDTIPELHISLEWLTTDHDCQNPPSEAALLRTATELAHIVSSTNSLRRIRLYHAIESIPFAFMATFVRLESVHFVSCPLVTANIQWAFSFTTLRQLSLGKVTIPDESIHAFCRAISFSCLQYLSMDRVSFPPEYQEQIATTIARCKTLEQLDYPSGPSLAFCHCYSEALSNNFIPSSSGCF